MRIECRIHTPTHSIPPADATALILCAERVRMKADPFYNTNPISCAKDMRYRW